ncbi:MAG: alpha/beta hydrolase [Clostridiales bacterium]|nr:alpha/beta hydrolase [Clostridiales bacterium]
MERKCYDPEVYEFYKAAIEGPGFDAPFDVRDIAKLRENEITGHAAHLDPYEVYEKHDIIAEREGADPLKLRVYVPDDARGAGAKLPVLLYFHGGGFIMGSIEDHDPLCGKLADECGAVVIAPEYRLAPEDPFPACIEDAVFTAEWAASHAREYGGDPARIMAGGDSSGANISAVLALLGREGKAPEISGLILFYGIFGCIPLESSGSARTYGHGECVLPVNAARKMVELYIPDGTDPDDYRISPGKADLKGMPPAIVVTAELDPLRDDGEEFARRLEESGNEVQLVRMDGMMHGFVLYWQRFSRAGKLLEQIGSAVRKRNNDKCRGCLFESVSDSRLREEQK